MSESSWPLILVTGACGYIGSHVVLELLKQAKFGVVALDNLTNSSFECLRRVRELAKDGGGSAENSNGTPPLYFHQTDIREQSRLQQVFDLYKTQAKPGKNIKNRILHVIHFAALKSVSGSKSNPESYYSTNVLGTANLLNVMVKSGVFSIVFSSSAVVYGQRNEANNPKISRNLLPESACRVYAYQTEAESRENFSRITNPYGQTKLMCEDLIHKLCCKTRDEKSRYGPYSTSPAFRAVILRYTNPSGNHPSGLIGDSPIEAENLMPIAAQVLQGKRKFMSIFGADYPTKDGTGIRDFIHVQDLATGHLAALDELERGSTISEDYTDNCKTYNLGTGKGASVMEVIEALMKVSGKSINFKIAARRAGDLAVVVCDPLKAEIELGWKAEKGVEEMARDLWLFCSKNPNGLV
ncbi:hypothetical protein BY996DRAFT_4600897 [Phakopsora pachyrhizi]|uniref:NAD-dependent epimerase/dehydratase domain-containing protein n=1 Tax=Phakopsora pachyrhizi TaxID=170000 RepID=A0AAV0BCI2_PHAPC|nr:hypothetical protein BY996DRAFT_4600897 [Phakopsora pachyrhizi]CAH7683391.1 hypothetical protein PPACK8108_LOCUS16873 [Phakopsora pachyrhizi]